jgi:hypothetical protein
MRNIGKFFALPWRGQFNLPSDTCLATRVFCLTNSNELFSDFLVIDGEARVLNASVMVVFADRDLGSRAPIEVVAWFWNFEVALFGARDRVFLDWWDAFGSIEARLVHSSRR